MLRNVSEVKQRIFDLPLESTVVWLEIFTGVNRSTAKGRTLHYPPSNIVGELKQTARDHHVKMELDTDAR